MGLFNQRGDNLVNLLSVVLCAGFSVRYVVCTTAMQAGMLLEEAVAAAGKSGPALEAASILTPLLSGIPQHLKSACSVSLVLFCPYDGPLMFGHIAVAACECQQTHHTGLLLAITPISLNRLLLVRHLAPS